MRPYILFLCIFFITCPYTLAGPNTSQVDTEELAARQQYEAIEQHKKAMMEEIEYKASYGKNWKKELEADKKRHNEWLDEYFEKHPNLPQHIKKAILNEQVIIGMDAEAVSLAIGSPDSKLKTITANNISEQWIYNNRYYIYFINDIVITIQEIH